MYRFYFTILLLIMTVVNVLAQKTIDRATYENAVDHLNCELAKFYMLKEQGTYVQNEYLTYASTHPCSYENLMVFIQGKQPQLENNGYLATYIEGFKEEFDEQITNGALFNNLTEIFKQEFLIDYEGDEDFQNLKFALKENYLKEKLKINEIEGVDGIENTEEERFDFWEWLSVGNFFLILLGIFVLSSAYTVFKWAGKYFNTGKEKISTKNLSAHSVKPKSAANTSTQTINEKLKRQTSTVKTPTVEKNALEKQVEAVMKEIPEEKTEEAEPEEFTFYMSYPRIDGSFYDLESSKTEIAGQSTFKFKLINEKYFLATFEIISNDKIITDIFMDYERTIKPVCDIEGNPKQLNKVIRPGIKNIVTVTPGTVQKTAQHWRLKKKALIRFEYE